MVHVSQHGAHTFSRDYGQRTAAERFRRLGVDTQDRDILDINMAQTPQGDDSTAEHQQPITQCFIRDGGHRQPMQDKADTSFNRGSIRSATNEDIHQYLQ